MKSHNGIYIPQGDYDEMFPNPNRYSSSYSPRTIEQMAKGCTQEQFQRQCNSGLQMVNDAGELVSGPTLFELYKQFCRGANGNPC